MKENCNLFVKLSKITSKDFTIFVKKLITQNFIPHNQKDQFSDEQTPACLISLMNFTKS